MVGDIDGNVNVRAEVNADGHIDIDTEFDAQLGIKSVDALIYQLRVVHSFSRSEIVLKDTQRYGAIVINVSSRPLVYSTVWPTMAK